MIPQKILEIAGVLLLMILMQYTSMRKSDAQYFTQNVMQLFQLGANTDSTNGVEGTWSLVTAVVDGDTLKIEVDGQAETVRLIGIDTPEVVDPRRPVQCFGREASQKAKDVLLNQRVRLVADATQSERDKYGRLLRYVFLEDGTSFNQLMIEEGYAHEYTYDSNPYQYQSGFLTAERLAREGKRGLWNEQTCGGTPL
jgi:micrococcal nuclease